MITNEATRRPIVCLAILLFVSAAIPAGAEEPQVVASADGTSISYTVHGEGEPTLVLVHGWNCDAGYWRGQVPHFSARHRVVVVDLAAHGRSGATRERYTMQAFGEDVRAVADAVGGEEIILVGHSMGGAVIAEAARLMPGRVVGLIGIDTLQNIEHPLTEEDVDGMVAPFEADFVTACRSFAGGMILPNTDPELREWIVSDMAASPPEAARSQLREYMSRHVTGEAAAIFEELPLPVVTVDAGLWPIDYEANRRHMQSFDAIVLEGSDHFMMLTRTDDFNRAFEEAIAMVTVKTP